MEPTTTQPKKGKKWPWIVGGIVLLLIVIGMAGGENEAGVAATSAASSKPSVDVTARDLSLAYQQNEAKAQLAYEGKSLNVTGVVKDIDLSLGDAPVIKLKGGGDQYDMGVNADGKLTDVNVYGLSKQDAAAIDKGKSLSFACTEVSEVMGSPQLNGCTIAVK